MDEFVAFTMTCEGTLGLMNPPQQISATCPSSLSCASTSFTHMGPSVSDSSKLVTTAFPLGLWTVGLWLSFLGN